VPIQKWQICPISALREKFNPRNINPMPAVKFFARLDLEQIILSLDGHYKLLFIITPEWFDFNQTPARPSIPEEPAGRSAGNSARPAIESGPTAILPLAVTCPEC
jgi:hypothetical protein